MITVTHVQLEAQECLQIKAYNEALNKAGLSWKILIDESVSDLNSLGIVRSGWSGAGKFVTVGMVQARDFRI